MHTLLATIFWHIPKDVVYNDVVHDMVYNDLVKVDKQNYEREKILFTLQTRGRQVNDIPYSFL